MYLSFVSICFGLYTSFLMLQDVAFIQTTSFDARRWKQCPLKNAWASRQCDKDNSVKDAKVRRRRCFTKLTSFAGYTWKVKPLLVEQQIFLCRPSENLVFQRSVTLKPGKTTKNNRYRVCTLLCCQHRLFWLPISQKKTSTTDVVLHRRVAMTYWADMFQRRVEELCWYKNGVSENRVAKTSTDVLLRRSCKEVRRRAVKRFCDAVRKACALFSNYVVGFGPRVRGRFWFSVTLWDVFWEGSVESSFIQTSLSTYGSCNAQHLIQWGYWILRRDSEWVRLLSLLQREQQGCGLFRQCAGICQQTCSEWLECLAGSMEAWFCFRWIFIWNLSILGL